VDAWKKIDNFVASGDNAFAQLKKSPDFLKIFDEVVNNEGLYKHIFKGDPKYENGLLRDVGGVHSNKYLKPSSQTTGFIKGDVRIQPGTEKQLGNGYYEAKVQVYGDKGVRPEVYTDDWLKGKNSTFFPDSWSIEKIQAEIARGINNKVIDTDFKVTDGNTAFKAIMSDGVKLQIVYSGDKIISAFPNLR